LDGKKISEEIDLYDSAFFELFSFRVLKGNLNRALDDPESVVLSEDAAKKYFGENDPIGDQLEIKIANEDQLYTVKAVIENPPSNFTFNYSIIAPYINAFQFIPEDMARTWFTSFGETFVLLGDEADYMDIPEKMEPVMKNVLGERYEEEHYNVFLRPMKEMHLGKELEHSMFQASDIKYVFIITGIAILILLLASINFTTLSIGKSFARAKEVGVRKVVGSTRGLIIWQFLGESIIMTFLGFGLALLIASLILPWFNDLLGISLKFRIGWLDAGIFFVFGFLVGILSGSYPALLISGFQSYKILKGDFGGKLKKHNLRKGLVAVQFIIAIAFISVTLLMMAQFRYLMNKDLGFDKDQLICVSFESDISQGLEYSVESAIEKGEKIGNAFKDLAGVEQVGFSTNKFDGSSWIRIGSAENENEDVMEVFSASFIDPGFIPSMKIELKEGRNFSELNAADYKNAVIINEAMARKLEWENPLDEQLPGRYESHEIIGVVKDFNFETMHTGVKPLYLTMNPEFVFEAIYRLSMSSLPGVNMYVKIRGGEIQSTLKNLEEVSLKVFPDEPFDYEFIDESIQVQYKKEKNMNKIISSATILAIIISSLGLFGLSFLTMNARTKEIGIRKALGASFGGLLVHLIKDYLIIIVLAAVIATPIAYYFIRQWLMEFEFKIHVLPQHFLSAVMITLIISMLTVSYFVVKSARKNPVDSLRYE